jgi:hypothetical protein
MIDDCSYLLREWIEIADWREISIEPKLVVEFK